LQLDEPAVELLEFDEVLVKLLEFEEASVELLEFDGSIAPVAVELEVEEEQLVEQLPP